MNGTPIGAALMLSFALAAWPQFPALADKGQNGKDQKDGVQPLFGLTTPPDGPFPSDRFTKRVEAQNTCEQVDLPIPDCTNASSTCFETSQLNLLDGFNTRPRISIPFDGDIDFNTVNSENIFLVSLGDSIIDGAPGCLSAAVQSDDGESLPPPDAGWKVGIDQTVWDPSRKTLHVEAAETLEQHTRYVVFVTRGVKDKTGEPIETPKAFKKAIGDDEEDDAPVDSTIASYQATLRRAVEQAHFFGVKRHDIAVASVFTTLSVTAAAEKIRAAVMATPTPPPADFQIANGGGRAVFDLGKVTRITYHRQGFPTPSGSDNNLTNAFNFLRSPDAIKTLAYGRIQTPNYLQPDGTMIPFATYSGSPTQLGMSDLYFALMLPKGTPPATGWPVVIWGHANTEHGVSGSQLRVAADFASHGIATLSWNQVGYGFGAASTLTVEQTGGPTLTFPMAGRSYDLNGDRIYENAEGSRGIGDTRILFDRDPNRQGIADIAQIIRVIEGGVEVVDGDGVRVRLDPEHVYYGGLSKGAVLGVLATAVEPRFKASALSSPNGFVEFQRVPAQRGATIGVMLEEHAPPLLNPPGTPVITQLGEPGGMLAVTAPPYNENVPAPGQPPIAGALEIQEYFERLEWLNANNAAGAFMPYLRTKPINGPARPVLIQMAKGDRTTVNPNVAYAIRSGLLEDRVTLFRYDLWPGRSPLLDPHTFVSATDIAAKIAFEAQDQIAAFYNSNGANILDPDGADLLFEAPVAPGSFTKLLTDFGFFVQ